MENSAESKSDDADKELLGSSSSSLDLKKVKPPNKKKHDDEVEAVQNEIKEKETQLKLLAGKNILNQLKETKAEKFAVIEKLKKIDTELKSLSQQITKKKGVQDQLHARLHYRTEERIDESVRRLEWQLKVQNFKLTEEKKIVAEIDSLKRSKKDLSQFLAVKKEVDEIRDRQRRMREERDRYQKNVNQLRNKEDEFKKLNDEKKGKLYVLKKEIDKLYIKKRQMIQDFRHLEKEYNDVKEEMKKQKKRDSFKRKEESKSHMEAFQNDIQEYGIQKDPYEDEIKLCNTLINYLQKFQVTEDEVEEPSKNPGVVDELDDGKYILLKKTEDNEYSGVRPTKRRPSKKGKKVSVTKPITHAPQIFSQFASLMLTAPSTIAEIPISIEQIQARKNFYEEGGQIRTQRVITPSIEEHSASETGISATESAMCEMSRQASNTESTENPEVSYCVLDELVKLSGNDDNLSEKSEDTLARSNSDSTERAQSEGDNSDLSIPSQTEHESRKGSDVSETDSPLNLKKTCFPLKTLDSSAENKTNIPMSHDIKFSSSDEANSETSTETVIPNFEAVVSDKLYSDTAKCGVANLSNLMDSASKSDEVKLPYLFDSASKSIEVKEPVCFLNVSNCDDVKGPHFSDEVDSLPEGYNVENADSIGDEGDRFIVIDDNSNIHDMKESSNGEFKNILEEEKYLFSTHL